MQQQQVEEEQQQKPLMLPVGYKFRPTDRELLFYFLKNKLKDQTMFQSAAPIYDIQLYDHHPQIILDNFGKQEHNNNPECYVFTMRHRKSLHGDRANRILKDNVGYWRASYKNVDNFQERRQGGLVGEKMNLVYYDTTTTTSTDKKKGSKKGTKTDWLMNEYKIKPANNDDGAEEDLVLCRIYLNNRQGNKGSNHQKQQYNMQQEQPYLQQQQQQQYMQQEQLPPEQPYLQQQQEQYMQQQQEQYMQQEQPYLQQQQQQQYMQQEQLPPEQPYLQQQQEQYMQQQQEQYMQQEQPYLQQQQEQYMQQEQPYLQQQQEQYIQQQQEQQQQQLAAVEDQAASNTGIYSIDTEIDAHTFWDQLMSQPAEPQQTGTDHMISIDDYA